MINYSHKDVESKWQKKWEEDAIYHTDIKSNKQKWYGLVEFPYPSGAGLHVGHVRSYTGMDIIARKRRAEGHEVLFPIGWDAFGLPAENYAIKTGIHPSVTTRQNIDTFRRQLKACGFSFDWSREVDTTDPNFYRWSQWIFLKLYEKGLAYKKQMPVNWCPKDKCVLANEEVVDGKCERCGTEATKKDKEQWMLAITKYAERLDKDLDDTAYLDKIKIQQRNWIGLSEGSEIDFGIKLTTKASFKFEDKLIVDIILKQKRSTRRLDAKNVKVDDIILLCKQDGSPFGYGKVTRLTDNTLENLDISYVGGTSYESKDEQVRAYKSYYGDGINLSTIFYTIDFDFIPASFTVFTTRADTLFGCTYSVLAPEHPLVTELLVANQIANQEIVVNYQNEAKQKLDIDRSAEGREKTGVKLEGVMAINPANGEAVPVFIADYVLPQYGTGAIMAVPGHDRRDYEFAKKYAIPVREVIAQVYGDKKQDAFERNRVGVVIEHEGRFLCEEVDIVGTKFNSTYVLLGGGIEKGEDSLHALKRELQEEIGAADVEDIKLLGTYRMSWFSKNRNENRTQLQTIYSVQIDVSKIIENKQEAKLIWLSGEDLLKAVKDDSPDQHSAVQKYILQKDLSFTTDDGELINSGEFDGLTSAEARLVITEKVGGKIVTKSKLRDWVFARQRYWGEPIPIVYDKEGGMYPVSESEFPIVLPQVDKYEPTDNGESPLSQVPSWVYVKGKINETGHFVSDESGEEFRRETDTMPQWAGSSWYFMRYIDPHNNTAIGDKKLLAKWLPVDWYNGGMEHTTLHLLYSRFWYKFLYDIGVVPTDEPYHKRTSQGMILGIGGVKMSKSIGNVVNPDDIIDAYGADTLRIYEMFIGPFDQAIAWNSQAVQGVKRFLDKVYACKNKVQTSSTTLSSTHQMIQKVTEGIESMSFNTCVSQMMIMVNILEKESSISSTDYSLFLLLLAPFAPHITEELWHLCGNSGSIHKEKWPIYDESRLRADILIIAIQVSGKLRGTIECVPDIDEELLKNTVIQGEIYKRYVGDVVPKKIIVVKNKILNIVL